MVQTEYPPQLAANISILSKDEIAIAQTLVNNNQQHVFANWPAPGVEDADKKRFLAQAIKLDSRYPGGIKTYVQNSIDLLRKSKEGHTPFDSMEPSVPEGQRLASGTKEFDKAEEMGLKELGKTGFVLVAGGLGERLGFSGIKVALPTEISTGMTYIQLYINFILEFQERARRTSGDANLTLPLAIMTSGDTHNPTVKLLEDNNFFGMKKSQITLMKQEKVASIQDNEGRFALDEKDQYNILTKPHGHGDVHTLLQQCGAVKKWVNNGIDWIVFFQDTNGLVFRSLPAALGVSKANHFEVNSVTVPRKPGEAVGAICKLTHKKTSVSCTINVEYNQLGPLLADKGGDIQDETGYSPFPGNINVLVFASKPYCKILEKTGGAIPEFVNPKYADAKKDKFKLPTRLECMMQSYPELLEPNARVGFTQLERWMSFSPVKNSIKGAQSKYKETGFPESGASGESDMYELGRRLLSLGKNVALGEPEQKNVMFEGIPFKSGPRVVLSPSFGLTQQEIKNKLSNSNMKVSQNSTLLINGENINIENLNVDGTLILVAEPGSSITIKNLDVKNKGWDLKAIDVNDVKLPQTLRIRGYDLQRNESRLIHASKGQHIVIDNN